MEIKWETVSALEDLGHGVLFLYAPDAASESSESVIVFLVGYRWLHKKDEAEFQVLHEGSTVFEQFTDQSDRIISEVKIEALTFLLDESKQNQHSYRAGSILVRMHA